MDITQIVLGLSLLVISSVTFVGPSVLTSYALIYALAGSALVIATGALLVGMASDV